MAALSRVAVVQKSSAFFIFHYSWLSVHPSPEFSSWHEAVFQVDLLVYAIQKFLIIVVFLNKFVACCMKPLT